MSFENSEQKFTPAAKLEKDEGDDTKERWEWEVEALSELIESEKSGEKFLDFQEHLQEIEDGEIIHPEEKRPLTPEEREEELERAIHNHQFKIEELEAKLKEAEKKLEAFEEKEK